MGQNTTVFQIVKVKDLLRADLRVVDGCANRFRCELRSRHPIPRRSDRFVRALVSPVSALSYVHVTELVAERGVEVDASCIWRWVQAYAPELNKRCRPHLKPANKSYRIDETYINVKGEDKYLYRALDSTGQTIDFLLTAKRDTAAAKRFLRRAIDASGNPMPRVMNVDKNPAYPAAVEAMRADGTIPRRVALRQCKYLNNVIEQDHRTVKKRVWLAKGYGSFQSAWRTLQGIETVNMIRKGRVRWLAKEDAVGQGHFIGELFGLSA
jgi:transposase, IS6 family